MFKEARIKLTLWYLLIIMAISLSFSGVIYFGVNNELTRIENFQRVRIQGIIRGFPIPIEASPNSDIDTINESRLRIILTLSFINLSILALAGIGGYFLAGITLDPISRMFDDQKSFVSNASHELRTPLTALKTEIEVALRDKKLSLSEAKELLASNLEDVNKMTRLSNYLLKLNKFDNVENKLEFKKVDLAIAVKKAIGKDKIETNLRSTTVLGDEDSLIELVLILVDNAKKYSKNKTDIKISTKDNTLTVEDNGVGISKEDLPHVFDRFYRGDKARETEGYGLGLSIAKSIVDLHNANINVESKIGKGTTFTVTF